MLARPGGDLLSHVLRRSTIGAEGFHGRVRDGIGWITPRQNHQVVRARALARALCVRELVGSLSLSGARAAGALALGLPPAGGVSSLAATGAAAAVIRSVLREGW